MPPKMSAHPKYEDMVKAAILALKDKKGSSVPAIAKYLAANFKLPANFKKILSTQLKNLVKAGKLLKIKASYKLGDALKKAPKKPKKKAAKKPKKKAAKKPKKKAAKKPKKAKKAAAKKAVKKPKKAKKATKKAVSKKK
ncbi:histone H1 linker protein [Micromonas pusilla CCMP1545]|jgi:histone H1/5|uniref:Histone H1 linker protein n=1 Tax=Micromonas pusilla (strain CCMP1545) TaxID=564608 RepID=C1MKH2_MICPC|nr:histone H1 linker protein [Micromonas pusilla CCMP1545]EEH59373.1 histone H1 linker protein [Micromonas pusilla CCMP1545]|eukprot:XP_003055997.1 histone H1 linker protein [Micromonas pusilla CCMP1545]